MSAPTTNITEPILSSNYDAEQASRDFSPLLSTNGGKWALTASGKGVERSFRFRTFKKTWEFMNTVAEECKVRKHHPEWSNVYNTTFVRWTTHSPPGLSEKDVLMAKYCDQQAANLGEVESEASHVGRELADRVAKEGGDCCVPRKKES